MSTTPATSLDEQPFWFAADGQQLLGITTRPTVAPVGIGLVVCAASAWVTTIGPNRFHVRLARRFAAKGFHAVRFDYGGIGDSTGASRPYVLTEPFTADAVAAASSLSTEGITDVILLGSCYGARTALVAATETEHVRGVALFAPPVRNYPKGERVASLPATEMARRLFRRSTLRGLRVRHERQRFVRIIRRRAQRFMRRFREGPPPAFEFVSPSFSEPLAQLIDRGIPVLIVYGEDDDFYADFTHEPDGPIAKLIARAGDLLTVTILPGRAYGLASVVVQERILDAIDLWLTGLVEPASSGSD